MPNFTNSRNQVINSAYTYPCIYEDIYISGLNDNEILISFEPNFMQNTNGMIIGIDSRFTDFYVINRDQNIVKSLNLTWIDNCLDDSSVQQDKHNSFNPFLFILVFIILLIIVTVYLKRRRK